MSSAALLLAAAFAAQPPMASKPATQPPPAPAALGESFAKRYPNPMINGTDETRVPGLKVIWVFDKSQLVEDPIVPRPWFDTADGAKFPGNVAGLSKALEHLEFVPKSDSDAIAVLEALTKADHNGELVLDPKSHAGLKALPQDVRETVRAPSVVARGDSFVVTGFVFEAARKASRFRQQRDEPASVHSIALEVGPGRCQLDFRPKRP